MKKFIDNYDVIAFLIVAITLTSAIGMIFYHRSTCRFYGLSLGVFSNISAIDVSAKVTPEASITDKDFPALLRPEALMQLSKVLVQGELARQEAEKKNRHPYDAAFICKLPPVSIKAPETDAAVEKALDPDKLTIVLEASIENGNARIKFNFIRASESRAPSKIEAFIPLNSSAEYREQKLRKLLGESWSSIVNSYHIMD